MLWWNPWARVRELELIQREYQVAEDVLRGRIKKLEFINKENEREIKVLEDSLKEAKATLAQASKNDTRDSKGRFTKAN